MATLILTRRREDAEKNKTNYFAFCFSPRLRVSTSKGPLSLMRFVWSALATFLLCLIAVLALNALVDPYAAQNGSWLPRNCKVKTLDCQRLTKAAAIRDLKPKAILLGTSRILEGMNAEQVSEVIGVDTYNLGLSSANMEEMFAYFEHALYHQPDLQVVVIGLDLFSFNQRHVCAPDFVRNQLCCADWPLWQTLPLVLSWDALTASYNTLKMLYRYQFCHQVPDRQYLDLRGDIEESLVERHGRKRRPDFYDLERFTLAGFANIPQNYGAFTLDPNALCRFQQLVRICTERGIVLKVFISPCRAIYWQLLYEKGLWDVTESWKRALVQAADLWDFSGVTPLTTEPFKPIEHSHFFESSHYRPHVGLHIAKVLFLGEESLNGRHLTKENLESHLVRLHQDQIEWADANPQIVAFLQTIESDSQVDEDAL
jgi:hypothetical protein